MMLSNCSTKRKRTNDVKSRFFQNNVDTPKLDKYNGTFTISTLFSRFILCHCFSMYLKRQTFLVNVGVANLYHFSTNPSVVRPPGTQHMSRPCPRAPCARGSAGCPSG